MICFSRMVQLVQVLISLPLAVSLSANNLEAIQRRTPLVRRHEDRTHPEDEHASLEIQHLGEFMQVGHARYTADAKHVHGIAQISSDGMQPQDTTAGAVKVQADVATPRAATEAAATTAARKRLNLPVSDESWDIAPPLSELDLMQQAPSPTPDYSDDGDNETDENSTNGTDPDEFHELAFYPPPAVMDPDEIFTENMTGGSPNPATPPHPLPEPERGTMAEWLSGIQEPVDDSELPEENETCKDVQYAQCVQINATDHAGGSEEVSAGAHNGTNPEEETANVRYASVEHYTGVEDLRFKDACIKRVPDHSLFSEHGPPPPTSFPHSKLKGCVEAVVMDAACGPNFHMTKDYECYCVKKFRQAKQNPNCNSAPDGVNPDVEEIGTCQYKLTLQTQGCGDGVDGFAGSPAPSPAQ